MNARRLTLLSALLILAGALLFCLFRAGSRDITRFIMSSGSLDVNETLSLNEAGELVVGGISTAGKVAVILGFAVCLAVSLMNLPGKEEKA